MGSKFNRQPQEGEVAPQSRGEVSRQEEFSQPTQPIPKPICDRSGQPEKTQDVFVVKGETSRSEEIDEKCFHEELCSSDRAGQLDKHKVERQDAPEVHCEITMLNTDNELTRERIEEDMDFKIPGLPHSTVKQLHSASVRELIH